jgi:putative membrane protein
MKTVADALIVVVALEHLWFLVLEMFLWTKPAGLRTFRMTAEKAKESAALAANQGLYNGFLAAGLVWGLLAAGTAIKVFFLVCVVVAGLFGAATVSRRILFVQAGPAALALALLLLAADYSARSTARGERRATSAAFATPAATASVPTTTASTASGGTGTAKRASNT